MPALTELKGKQLGSTKVRLEAGPVRAFARAVTDDPTKYEADDAIVPPTYPFSWFFMGALPGERAPGGLPIEQLRGPGRMILHGEQEFEWHRPARVGDVLEATARVSDVYEKDSSSALMEFYVTETSWTDASTGEPVCDARFTLIVRDTAVKKTSEFSLTGLRAARYYCVGPMANVLEFLRGLLTSSDEQTRFAGNPHGYLTAHNFGDLSGEDVVEAIHVARRSMSADIVTALAPYDAAEDGLPAARPHVGESELDAAIRQLQYAISLTPTGAAAAPPPPPPAPPEPEPEPEPEPTWADTVPEEPVMEPEPAASPPPPPPPSVAPVGPGVDPYAAFGEELAAIIRHAGQQMEEVLRRAEGQADGIIKQAENEGDTIRTQAGEEAASMRQAATEEASAIRAAAEVDAQNLRQNATSEADAILQAAKSAREEARIFKQSTRDEANAILQNARSTQEDAQRQSADLIKNAEREASAMLTDARTRRDEIREAERELRNRLSGVETVFRNLNEGSVVPDDPDE